MHENELLVEPLHKLMGAPALSHFATYLYHGYYDHAALWQYCHYTYNILTTLNGAAAEVLGRPLQALREDTELENAMDI